MFFSRERREEEKKEERSGGKERLKVAKGGGRLGEGGEVKGKGRKQGGERMGCAGGERKDKRGSRRVKERGGEEEGRGDR